MACKDNTRAQVTRIGKCKKVVIANVVWRSTCEKIASTTPQEWLVAGSHLGFAEKSFHSIASDKKRRQKLRVTMKKIKSLVK